MTPTTRPKPQNPSIVLCYISVVMVTISLVLIGGGVERIMGANKGWGRIAGFGTQVLTIGNGYCTEGEFEGSGWVSSEGVAHLKCGIKK